MHHINVADKVIALYTQISTTFEQHRIFLIRLELRNWIFKKLEHYASLNSCSCRCTLHIEGKILRKFTSFRNLCEVCVLHRVLRMVFGAFQLFHC
jgi:hypothetical protein